MKEYLTNKTYILYGAIFSSESPPSKTYGGEWDDSEDIKRHVEAILSSIISKPIRVVDIIHAYSFTSITVALKDNNLAELPRQIFSRTLDSITHIQITNNGNMYSQTAVPNFIEVHK